MTTNPDMSHEEQLIMTAYPIFKGKIQTKYGAMLFGRLWHKWELGFFTSECERQGIDIIWNLLEDSHGDIGPAKELHSPIDDFGTPNDAEAFCRDADTIIAALKAGKKVFVHCHTGKGRTALALASVLVRLGAAGEEALSIVREPTLGPETDVQCQFVVDISRGIFQMVELATAPVMAGRKNFPPSPPRKRSAA
jgi:hypothetical protein